MYRQLYIFIVQYVLILIGEEIDTAFINNVSLDAICVLSAFHPIMWTVYKVLFVGKDAYDVIRKDRMNCLVVSIGCGFITMTTLIALSGVIPHIYTLTDTQYELFTKALIFEALGLVPMAFGEMIYQWLLLECNNKLIFGGNVLYYVLMIVSDAYVFINHLSLEYFMLATTICWILYDIFLAITSKFFIKEKIELAKIKVIVKHGSRMMVDGLAGKVATLFYNIFASKLGTELYAIHAICYNICSTAECITDAVNNFTLVHLVKFKDSEKLAKAKEILKDNSLKLIILIYVTGSLLLLLTHGKMSYKECFPFMLIYISDLIALMFYEVYRGYLVCREQTKIIRNCGFLGILIRIPTVLIGYYSGLGVLGFALPCTIDFTIRAIYFKYKSERVHYECSIQ